MQILTRQVKARRCEFLTTTKNWPTWHTWFYVCLLPASVTKGCIYTGSRSCNLLFHFSTWSPLTKIISYQSPYYQFQVPVIFQNLGTKSLCPSNFGWLRDFHHFAQHVTKLSVLTRKATLSLFDSHLRSKLVKLKIFSNDPKLLGHRDFVLRFWKIIGT